MNSSTIVQLPSKDLCFDTENPRMVEKDLNSNSSELEIITFLFEEMDVYELILSMAASGFFAHEPLMVDDSSGKNIVVEGNRRLAAIRLLLNPTISEECNITRSIPLVADDVRNTLIEIPTITETRRELWKFLGFKHVNGPAKWSSYAKSKYVADVHLNYGIDLDEIARQIGDTHQTVQRLFRGLMVIQQAENNGVFNRKDIYRRHFAFSHLYTGIAYPNISKFIGLKPVDEESNAPIPESHFGELGELCLWLYGSKSKDISPIIRSQNPDLRRLEETLGNAVALISLRKGDNLDIAHELRLSPEAVFSKALLDAKQSLQKARGMLTDGYNGSEDLLRTAGSIANVAEALYDEMHRLRTNDTKVRLVEES